MDKLKQILKKSKPTTQTVVQKTALVEQQKRFEEQREQEKREQEQLKKKRLAQLQDFYEFQYRRKKVKLNQEIETIVLKKEEIKKRLRELHQPITLFAETDVDRYKRLQKIEEFYRDNPTFDMKNYDEEFQYKLKEQLYFTELDAKYRDRLIEPKLGDDPLFIKRKTEMILRDEENVSFENMCDEIILWIHKMLRDWNQALQQKYNSEDLRQRYKENWERYEQSCEQIRSLIYVLRKRTGDKDMIRSIYHVMNCCLVREYIQANDKYLSLSIGIAPWPMGVAMLNLTIKRNGPKVSHVLDDPISRKWMQVLKRFISISQQIYPNSEESKKVGYSVKSAI